MIYKIGDIPPGGAFGDFAAGLADLDGCVLGPDLRQDWLARELPHFLFPSESDRISIEWSFLRTPLDDNTHTTILEAAESLGPGPWLVAPSPLGAAPSVMYLCHRSSGLVDAARLSWASTGRREAGLVILSAAGMGIDQKDSIEDPQLWRPPREHAVSGLLGTRERTAPSPQVLKGESLREQFGLAYNLRFRPEEPFAFLEMFAFPEDTPELPVDLAQILDRARAAGIEESGWFANQTSAEVPAVSDEVSGHLSVRQLVGTPAIAGTFSGHIRRTSDIQGTVLLTSAWGKEESLALANCQAVLVAGADRLHFAVLSAMRQHVPCIVQIVDAELLRSGIWVHVDGNTGIVTVE